MKMPAGVEVKASEGYPYLYFNLQVQDEKGQQSWVRALWTPHEARRVAVELWSVAAEIEQLAKEALG
jgi:hypothetical protein